MSVSSRAFATIICIGLVSCGLDDMSEGCGSEADALAAEGLLQSAGAGFDVAGLTMPLPQGYLYRIRGDVLELVAAPGVYCDSGEWGVHGDGYVRLQVYEDAAPADPFRDFPATHRGHAREQIRLGIGPFDYSFAHNALTWHAHAYFANVHHPRVIFMYLRTEMPVGGRHIGLTIHHFPGDTDSAVSVITAAIDEVARAASRGVKSLNR
ncbi:MAG: hypothetical protein OEN20_09935 [Gammaproteobacteria bacterium]|nr:hypothetical protein [Gammaproteobacteria bacterium]